MIYNPYIIMALVLIISIIAHEFGHWIYIKRQTGQSMKIYFTLNKYKPALSMTLPRGLTNHQILNCALFGVWFGLVPIMLLILMSKWHYYIFLLPIYMAGVGHDLRVMVDTIKLMNKEIFSK